MHVTILVYTFMYINIDLFFSIRKTMTFFPSIFSTKIKGLAKVTSEAVATFLWEDIVCRHGCFRRTIVNSVPQSKKHVKRLVKCIQILAYHAQANGMIEEGTDLSLKC
jgi:hypothetical protein